jgi:hypothetical protein
LESAVTELDDKYRPRRYDEDPPPVSLLNEVPEYRDRSAATVLHRWPKATPLRAQTQLLLGRLEGGVYLTEDAACRRVESETTLRQLYLRTQDQVRVLEAALELELE